MTMKVIIKIIKKAIPGIAKGFILSLFFII